MRESRTVWYLIKFMPKQIHKVFSISSFDCNYLKFKNIRISNNDFLEIGMHMMTLLAVGDAVDKNMYF